MEPANQARAPRIHAAPLAGGKSPELADAGSGRELENTAAGFPALDRKKSVRFGSSSVARPAPLRTGWGLTARPEGRTPSGRVLAGC
jgi:hypothetical protein